MVRLGQWAYSALMTMGLDETAAWIFRRCNSVRCLMRSAIAMAQPSCSHSPTSTNTCCCHGYALQDVDM
jgi:hypothetical protein